MTTSTFWCVHQHQRGAHRIKMDWLNRKTNGLIESKSHDIHTRNVFLSLSSLVRWLRQMSRAREDEYTWTRLLKTRLVKTRPIGWTLRDWHRRPTVFWRVYWQIELGFDHGVFDLQFYHHSVSDHLSAYSGQLRVCTPLVGARQLWKAHRITDRPTWYVSDMETTSYFWQTRAKHW